MTHSVQVALAICNSKIITLYLLVHVHSVSNYIIPYVPTTLFFWLILPAHTHTPTPPALSPLRTDVVDAVEGGDLLRARVPQPLREGDLPEVDVERPAPDRQPPHVLQGLPAGQRQHQVALAVALRSGEKKKAKEKESGHNPTNVAAHSLSVATLVVVSRGEGVDVWVAIRFSCH